MSTALLSKEFKGAGKIAPMLQLPRNLQDQVDICSPTSIVQESSVRLTQVGRSLIAPPDTAQRLPKPLRALAAAWVRTKGLVTGLVQG